jgi:predicted Zn-dependent protease
MARAAAATAAGQGDAAVGLLREAVALEPHRPEYRLSLAKALVTVGRPAEAEPYVQEALRQHPVNGEANLVLARIFEQQGNGEEAERSFYRAIYGRWPPSEQTLRMQARLELVNLYRRSGERGRLRAALLELSSAFPGDRELQLQAGRELLGAGFVDDAVRQLGVVVERFADAGGAMTLLAQAEFARGNYVEAYAAAGEAVARDPQDGTAAALRALTARVLALDPDQPRLSVRERATRLRVLLSDVRARLAGCGATSERTVDSLLPLLDQWLARPRADADLGRTLLEGAVRRLPAACLPSPDSNAVERVLADLVTERRR